MRHATFPSLLVLTAFAAPQEDPLFVDETIGVAARVLRLHAEPLDFGPTPDVAVIARRNQDEVLFASLSGTGTGALELADLEVLSQLGYTNTPTIATADFNGDGIVDIGLAGPWGQKLIGDGDLDYDPTSAFPTAGGSQHALGFTDFDQDGDLDSALVVNDIGEWWLDLGVNDGNGNFGGVSFLGAPGTPLDDARLLFADTDNDGADATYVVGGTGLAFTEWPGRFSPDELILAGSFGEVLAADLNGDGWLDLGLASPDENGVRVLPNDGAGAFPSSSLFKTARHPESLVVGDMDGDGLLDLAVANRDSDTVTILGGDGAGDFAPVAQARVGRDPVDIDAADFDLDGDLDLIVACDAGMAITILTNQTN